MAAKTTLFVAAAAALAIGWAVAAHTLHTNGVPATLTAWLGLFTMVGLITSFGTGWTVGVWWVMRVAADVGDDEGWEKRYRRALHLFDRSAAYKTERWIVIISFAIYFAIVCVISITSAVRTPNTVPDPSHRGDIPSLHEQAR